MANRILIAGIGAGSLGLELLKCVSLIDGLTVFGADIDASAVLESRQHFEETFFLDGRSEDMYLASLIECCSNSKIDFLLPGAEAVNRIISFNQDVIRSIGVEPLVNSVAVVSICTQKGLLEKSLIEWGLPAPETILLERGRSRDLTTQISPCVVKPGSDSGGSNLVFLAENLAEVDFFVGYLQARGHDACIQQYLESNDEYTIGVLSDKKGSVLSSIALRRNLNSKLSRLAIYENRVLSSGWSQGRIEDFPMIRQQAERIAVALNSVGPLNIQARVIDDVLYPFEINPRFSGTSFFRALAGVNEVDLAIRSRRGDAKISPAIRSGTFRRFLSEEAFFDGDLNR